MPRWAWLPTAFAADSGLRNPGSRPQARISPSAPIARPVPKGNGFGADGTQRFADKAKLLPDTDERFLGLHWRSWSFPLSWSFRMCRGQFSNSLAGSTKRLDGFSIIAAHGHDQFGRRLSPNYFLSYLNTAGVFGAIGPFSSKRFAAIDGALC
jgi:hypothetical protein